ncbi:hypothetical protein I9W82_001643 [Candida metapsilosis]|uniref:Serine protease n=1 Tax=Candida metapsilosis TaxID=273372 RepID=A0A8H7ZIH9_9ASCO|nr:hypothetical protein I9W82_001643 [Candida metapsilosis]
MKYSPIALQYVSGDTIHASSGVYITPPAASKSKTPFILTVNHIPRINEYAIYANLGVTSSSSSSSSSSSVVKWIRVSILEEVAINPSDFEFFNAQFKLYPRDQYGKTISILKLSSNAIAAAASSSLVSVAGSVATKSSIAVGDQVMIVSSPFNFTNSLIFHQFTTTARIVHKVHMNEHDADNGDGVGDYWLSDAAYMENMAGGAVIEKRPGGQDIVNGSANVDVNVGVSTNNNNNNANGNTAFTSNRLVGLVLGNLRKSNGDGNLMVIIPLRKIIQLSPSLLPPLSPPQSQSLIKSSSSILYKTISSTTLSKLFNLPSLATRLSSLSSNSRSLKRSDLKSVLPLIITASNQRTWGSCIFYRDNLLITNSHVVAPLLQKKQQSKSITKGKSGSTNLRKSSSSSSSSDDTLDSATILITNHGDSIQVQTPLDQYIIIPHPDLDLAFIEIDNRATTLLLENGYKPISPYSDIDNGGGGGGVITEGTSVYTQSYGLFFDPLDLQPLKSYGIVNCVYRQNVKGEAVVSGTKAKALTNYMPGLIIASASCFNGSSGGGLFTTTNDQLIGMICSNAKVYKPVPQEQQSKQQEQTLVKDTEKLITFTFVLPIQIIDYCYQQIYQGTKSSTKVKSINDHDNEVVNHDKVLVDIDYKILDLWKLKPFHKDVYIESTPSLPATKSKTKTKTKPKVKAKL